MYYTSFIANKQPLFKAIKYVLGLTQSTNKFAVFFDNKKSKKINKKPVANHLMMCNRPFALGNIEGSFLDQSVPFRTDGNIFDLTADILFDVFNILTSILRKLGIRTAL